jgi:hypothetical protein
VIEITSHSPIGALEPHRPAKEAADAFIKKSRQTVQEEQPCHISVESGLFSRQPNFSVSINLSQQCKLIELHR